MVTLILKEKTQNLTPLTHANLTHSPGCDVYNILQKQEFSLTVFFQVNIILTRREREKQSPGDFNALYTF